MLLHNRIYTTRQTHLRTRSRNRLNEGRSRTALAAALLRQPSS
jgi:hypothetical protein